MTTTFAPPGSSTRTSAADALSVLMNDALSVAAGEEDDAFSSDTAAGRTLLALAGLAREAAGRLGADPGAALGAGPGVVVVREFAAAVRLLEQARDGLGDVDRLLAPAQALRVRLHEAVPRR
ncbi:MAG TPA: hypothetical protein VK402_08355 [Blastococcus sp.]|nr:hypothetical protein [Blastococcus sp.]